MNQPLDSTALAIQLSIICPIGACILIYAERVIRSVVTAHHAQKEVSHE